MEPILETASEQKKNGSVKSVTTLTSPKKPERKNKFPSLSRLFKPWKWKRRKKSDKINETAADLERKISVRATREELIRKGVLKQDLVTTDTNHITPTDQASEDVGEAGTTNGEVNTDSKVTENGVTLADITPVNERGDHASSAADGKTDTSDPVTTSAIELNTSNNNATSTLGSVSVSHASLRPVIIPSTVPTSAPPPYNSVHAHIIVPANNNAASETTGSLQASLTSVSHDELHHVEPLNPHPPYMAVAASQPDFNKIPRKSALKTRPESNTQNSPRVLTRMTASFPVEQPPSPNNALPRSSTGPTFGGVRVLPSIPTNQPPVPRKPIPKPRLTIAFNENKENIPEHTVTYTPNAPVADDQPDYDNVHDSDSSDSDDIQYRDDLEDPNSLAAKVARQDSLARFLNNRPSRRELVEKNIIPIKTETEKQDDRETIGNKLTRRLSLRPTHQELHQRNILRTQTNEEHQSLLNEKKQYLIRKLSFRPSIEELRERKIIRFNDYIEVTQAQEYDRRADKPWTRLTPHDKATIRQELNEFKESEMSVHEESKHLTRFHRP